MLRSGRPFGDHSQASNSQNERDALRNVEVWASSGSAWGTIFKVTILWEYMGDYF